MGVSVEVRKVSRKGRDKGKCDWVREEEVMKNRKVRRNGEKGKRK